MNKKTFIFIMTCLLVFWHAFYIKAADYTSSNFNPRDRQLQPIPTGHIPGKDNSTKTGEYGTHNAGEDCGICHTPNGKSPNYVFTMAGTLYEDKAGRKPLSGGEVVLQDKDGNVISMTSNEVGNFWTYTPIASYPYSVSGHGTVTKLYTENSDGTVTPGDTNDSRSWLYKTWVKKDDQVIYAATIKPVGGGNTPRMGCSMHHSPNGSRGALWLTKNGTLSSYPATGLSFKKHILPIFMSRCVSCHRPGETKTRIVMKSDIDYTYPDTQSTQIDMSKSHDLTAYSDQTVTVSGTAWAKYGTGHYATGYSSTPDMSPLLLKTVKNGQNHGGGIFWTSDNADYKAIRQWIAEGAQNN